MVISHLLYDGLLILLGFYWTQFVETQTKSDKVFYTTFYSELDRMSYLLITLSDALALF